MKEELKSKMNDLIYYLVKNAARDSFKDFLEELDISDEDYEEIKAEWQKIGITKTYL